MSRRIEPTLVELENTISFCWKVEESKNRKNVEKTLQKHGNTIACHTIEAKGEKNNRRRWQDSNLRPRRELISSQSH